MAEQNLRKQPVICSFQLLLMSVGSALIFPYTFMPILGAPPRNQDVWIVLIITFIYIPLLNSPVLFLLGRFRGFKINEIIEMIMGKLFGKIISILFALFFIYCFSACMLIIALFINIFLLPFTPMAVILLYIIIPEVYVVFKGAGTIGKAAVFIVPFIIVSIVLFFVLGLSNMDINILKPVLADSTFLELNAGGFLTGARYSEILIFFVFSGYLQSSANLKKTYAGALAVFGVCFFMILMPVLLTLGVDLGQHAWNPYFMYATQVEGFGFIERMQALNTLAWFPGALLKIIIYNYMACHVLSETIKSKKRKISFKFFIIPLNLIAFILCQLPFMDNSATVEALRSDQVFPFIVLPFIVVLPLILVVVYIIRRKKIKQVILQKQKQKAIQEEVGETP